MKGEQILSLLRKFYREIGRKLIISYSNKMQPLLNVIKSVTGCSCWFLKKVTSIQKKTHKKTGLNLVTEVDEPKTSSFVKPRRWNNFIVKFQNINCYHQSQPKKTSVKNNFKQIKPKFFSRKVCDKSHQNFSTMLLGSLEIQFII